MTDRAETFLAAYGGDALRAIEFLLVEQEQLRDVIRESLESHRMTNAAMSALINQNNERRDFMPAIRDLQRALWLVLGNSEAVVSDDMPSHLVWSTTGTGQRLVRRHWQSYEDKTHELRGVGRSA